MAVTTNLGRVQGGGFYGSTSTSETSIPKSTVLSGGVSPLVNDVIVNANGDLCRITAVTSTAYTVSKFGSIKGPAGAQGPQGEKGDGIVDVPISDEDYLSFVIPLYKFLNTNVEIAPLVSGLFTFYRNNGVFPFQTLYVGSQQGWVGESGDSLWTYSTISLLNKNDDFPSIGLVSFDYNSERYVGLDVNIPAPGLSACTFIGTRVNTIFTDEVPGPIPYYNNNTKTVLNNEIYASRQYEAYRDTALRPIGSIYMSAANDEPGQLFGGTWEKLTGDAYLKIVTSGAGQYGGTSSEHKIPVASLPPHNHDVKFEGGDYNHYSFSLFGGVQNPENIALLQDSFTVGVHGLSGPLYTLTKGDGQAYYPYYYGIYVWRRVA